MDMDSTIAIPLNPDDPREIGQFKIIGLLGVGGMGEVYLGTADEGYVAVKRVRPRVVDRERFKREVGILYRVPVGVAPGVLANDSTVTRPWFATEYVPGVTVDDAVRLHGPLPPDTLWLLLAETAEQLGAVHEVKIVHRDLKPANLMLVRNGVKLIDFGIARAADLAKLTKGGESYGTRGYIAPEQEAGDPGVASAADVFALGALLLYAASGRTPGVVPDIEPLRAMDTELAAVIESCLIADPQARPTAVELAVAARKHVPDTHSFWPPEVMERIEARREFAATPVGKIDTLPPMLELDSGSGSGLESESASAESGEAESEFATPPMPPAGPRDDPSSAESAAKPRRRLLWAVVVVTVVAGAAVGTYFGITHTQSTNPRAGTITHPTSTLVAGGHASSAPSSSTGTASAKGSASASSSATSTASTLPSTAASSGGSSKAAASSGNGAAATTTTSTKAATTAVASPTSSSISAINGGDDTTQVPGSEADTDEMYGDAACSAWLDNNGSGDLAGVLNTSWDQSCVAELFRSDGVAYKFAASWAAEKTSFISDEGFTMWICVWNSSAESTSTECSPHFAMSGDTPVKQ